MSMHLEGPWLSTTGKSRRKARYRTAESAATARKNAEAWQQLLEKYDVRPAGKNRSTVQSSTRMDPVVGHAPVVDPKRSTHHIPSVDSGLGATPKRENMQYTGTNMLGIGVLHKSNSVPIFKAEDAVDISKMRRG